MLNGSLASLHQKYLMEIMLNVIEYFDTSRCILLLLLLFLPPFYLSFSPFNNWQKTALSGWDSCPLPCSCSVSVSLKTATLLRQQLCETNNTFPFSLILWKRQRWRAWFRRDSGILQTTASTGSIFQDSVDAFTLGISQQTRSPRWADQMSVLSSSNQCPPACLVSAILHMACK